MQIVVMLMMVLAIAASVGTARQDRGREVSAQAGAIAYQMAWHHNQAVRSCEIPNPSCPPGIVPVAAGLRQPGSAVDARGYFQSGTDGSLVVTTWVPASVGFAQAPMGMGGTVAAALRGQTMGSVYSGYWNAQTQTINGSTSFSYMSATGSEAVAIPSGFGGLSLADNAPIAATRIR